MSAWPSLFFAAVERYIEPAREKEQANTDKLARLKKRNAAAAAAKKRQQAATLAKIVKHVRHTREASGAEIAKALGMNAQYITKACRELRAKGKLTAVTGAYSRLYYRPAA